VEDVPEEQNTRRFGLVRTLGVIPYGFKYRFDFFGILVVAARWRSRSEVKITYDDDMYGLEQR